MTHRPERFEVYTELPDGSGFTIKDCDFVFRYDRHGGWRDEDRNYYNASGEPASTPEELSSSHDDRDNDDDDFFEDIARQYDYKDRDDDYSESGEEYSDEEIRNLESIDRNNVQLAQYPANKPLRVFYDNLERHFTLEKIRQLYASIDLLSILPDVVDGKHTGNGCFIVANKAEAKKLTEREGKAQAQRSVYYKVQSLQELMADPIPQSQLGKLSTKATSEQTGVSRIVGKSMQEQDKTNDSKPTPASQQKTAESPSTVVSTQPSTTNKPLPTNSDAGWSDYTFPLTLFKNPDDFKSWMEGLNLKFEEDYRELKRVKNPDNSVVGWLKLRTELYPVVHMKLHNGTPIELKPRH